MMFGALALAICFGVAGCTPSVPADLYGCVDTSQCPPSLVCSELHRCVRHGLSGAPDTVDPMGTQSDPPDVATLASGDGSIAADAGSSASAGSAAGAPAMMPPLGAANAKPGSAGTAAPALAGAAAPPMSGAAGAAVAAPARMKICTPNERKCDASNNLLTCSGDGVTQASAACPAGCNAQRSGCNTCTPGAAATCSVSTLSVCRADGSDYDLTTCASGCAAQKPECLSCTSAQHICERQCVMNDDMQHCGASCAACPSVPKGTAMCATSGCDFTCDADTARCSDVAACEKQHWEFETDLDDWHGVTGTGGMPAVDQPDDGQIMVSHERAHSGTGAIRSSLGVTNTRQRYQVFTGMCGSQGHMDVSGKTLQAWVYVTTAASSPGMNSCSIYGRDGTGTGNFGGQVSVTIPFDQWTAVRSAVISEASGARARVFGIDCRLGLGAASDWNGTIYLDDISVQ
jgi:hypothetical protein